MNRSQTIKIIHKVAAGWSSFRFWTLPEEARDAIVDAWHMILGRQEFANVERIVDRRMAKASTGQDAKWEAPPDAKDVLRELTIGQRQNHYHRASPEFRSEYAKMHLKMGMVLCSCTDSDGKSYTKWEKKRDAIHDGQKWVTKVEFILKHLPGAAARYRGWDIWKLVSSKEEAEKYFTWREGLLDEAMGYAAGNKAEGRHV